jgi:type VI secretion system protein ImpJ
MKHLQHVIWSKGTFLTPQHLQMQDRYVEDSLHFQIGALNFRYWGFSRLQIDEHKLVEGQFSITSAEGILPDGLPFSVPDSDPAPASRNISDCFNAQRTNLRVYLGIPDQRDHAATVSNKSDTKTRYASEVQQLRDENTGGTEKPIQVARKNLILLLEGESQEGYIVQQAAAVEKTSAGTFRLSPTFVPPTLNVHEQPQLLGIVRGLMETLTARADLLAGARRQKSESLADFTSADVASFWLLYTINSHLPLFRHVLHKSRVHPEQVFDLMLSFAGALTTFSMTIQPRDLPQYKHEDLGSCFTDLEQKIQFLLKTVIPTHFVSLSLKLAKPSIHATSIDNDSYLHNTRLYLAVSCDLRDADLITRAPQLMKVGAAGHLEDIIQHALPGLKLHHVPQPPPEIPIKLKHKYFGLDLTGEAWERIQRSRTFGVYVPNDFPNAQLELVILLPAQR